MISSGTITRSCSRTYKPASAVWYLPSFCNGRCAYCDVQDRRLRWFPDFAADKRNLKAFLHAAEVLHRIDIPWISFGGSEPLLFSSALKELFLALSGYGIGYGITTNWSIPPRKCQDILAHCHSVNLSFDSINPRYSLSKKNDCRMLQEFIAECRRINPRLLFNVTLVLSSHSADDMPRTLQWLFSLPDVGFVFVQPCSKEKYAFPPGKAGTLRQELSGMRSTILARSNLQELLEYYFEPEKRFLRKDCGMSFSQYRIIPRPQGKRRAISFIFRPCPSYRAEWAAEDWTYFGSGALSDTEQCVKGMDSVSLLLQETAKGAGGFYGSCNASCSCGPEMVLNDVFWGRRGLTMLTRDPRLRRKIEGIMAGNRRRFLAAVKEAMDAPVRSQLLSGISQEGNETAHQDLFTRKSVRPFPLPEAVRAAVKALQNGRVRCSLSQARSRLRLSLREYDQLRGLLFRGALRMFPKNSRSLM